MADGEQEQLIAVDQQEPTSGVTWLTMGSLGWWWGVGPVDPWVMIISLVSREEITSINGLVAAQYWDMVVDRWFDPIPNWSLQPNANHGW